MSSFPSEEVKSDISPQTERFLRRRQQMDIESDSYYLISDNNYPSESQFNTEEEEDDNKKRGPLN